MPRTYDILADFGIESTRDGGSPPDCVSTSPAAIVVVWRYRHPVTFSRKKGSSFSTITTDGVRLRDQPLFVVDDLRSLQVQNSKANHITSMSATLLPGMNYLTEIFPGDWIGAWIGNDDRTVTDVMEAIKEGVACNDFRSGLKFLGRVAAIRKRIQQNPNGIRTSSYLLNAAGFTELDANLYYDPHLAANSVGTATKLLQQTAININKIISANGQGIDLQKAIPVYLHAFFGTGIPKTMGVKNSDERIRSTEGLDNPDAFIIPDPVANTLGVKTGGKKSGAFAYTDILELLHGIQKYQLGDSNQSSFQSTFQIERTSEAPESGNRYWGLGRIFAPDGVPDDSSSRDRKTSHQMIGTFLPGALNFTGQKTVWSILQQYLNGTINEMYTCLRTNPQGEIFPTLIVRQKPFSSGIIDTNYKPVPLAMVADEKTRKAQEAAAAARFKKLTPTQKQQQIDANAVAKAREAAGRDLVLTTFFEVPRWLIHPVLIKSVDIGRSDVTRINFVKITPEAPGADPARSMVRDPPVRDDLDVYRIGLRPYIQTVPCAPQDAVDRRAGEWQYIMADILMGGHLLLNGSMEIQGVQSPICPGDNIEFDGHVFHIESVTHNYSIGAGLKNFSTVLTLVHGQNAHQSQSMEPDLSMYAGDSSDDLTTYDPGISRDANYSPSTPSVPETGHQSSIETGDQQPLASQSQVPVADASSGIDSSELDFMAWANSK